MRTPTHSHKFKELGLEVELPNYLIVEDHGNVKIEPENYLVRLAKKRNLVSSIKPQRGTAGATTYFESINGTNHFFYVFYCYRPEIRRVQNVFVRGHEEMHALDICIDIIKPNNPKLCQKIIESTSKISIALPLLIRCIRNKGVSVGGNEMLAECGGLYAIKKNGFSIEEYCNPKAIREDIEFRTALEILSYGQNFK